ncbi:MAG TPA: hypothetical protein VM263_00500 [Acidimicrobiales bacterium]|nr:hypothetical protein [Acidimicrobiales bacterium]
MSPARAHTGTTPTRPTVLVVAVPYVLATALAFELHRQGLYDVVVPAADPVQAARTTPCDAVLTALPLPARTAGVVIQLPPSFHEPVMVITGGATAAVTVDASRPIDDVMSLLARHLLLK